MNWKAASLLALAGLMICLFLLLATRSLFANGPVTIAIQTAAALLMLWARVTFGIRSFHAAANPTEGGVVTTGPYRYIRHPIYASIFYFLAGGVAAHPGVGSLALIVLAAVMLWIRMRAEEHLLLEVYPEEYSAYAAKTARILPGVF